MPAISLMGSSAPERTGPRREGGRLLPAAVAVAGVWAAVAAISIFTPDMITGTAHEHVPIAAITAWGWGVVATGFVLFGAAFPARDRMARWGLTIAVLGIWAAVTAASIFAPTTVTGTDPTTVPVAALISPAAGVIATAFACLAAAWSAVAERR